MAITISGNGITSANIADGTITNADINASAAIDGSKISGDFGKVLQIISNEAGIAAFNTASWTDVVTATITPSSTSSKILVLVSTAGYGGSEAKVKGNARILRGGTNIQYARSFFYRESTGAIKGSTSFLQKLDSPATTSATTYQAQVQMESGTNNLHLTDSDNADWVITLIEIAG